jgi:hypothetical protein
MCTLPGPRARVKVRQGLSTRGLVEMSAGIIPSPSQNAKKSAPPPAALVSRFANHVPWRRPDGMDGYRPGSGGRMRALLVGTRLSPLTFYPVSRYNESSLFQKSCSLRVKAILPPSCRIATVQIPSSDWPPDGETGAGCACRL